MKTILNKLKYIYLFILVFCAPLLISNTIKLAQPTNVYAQSQQTYQTIARQQLSSLPQNLYDYLSNQIQQIAIGTKTETKVVVDSDQLNSWNAKTKWTNAEFGTSSISINDVLPLFVEQFEMSNILSALLHDLPYEMYWFDKTVGISNSMQHSSTNTAVEIVSWTLTFNVSTEFQSLEYTSANPTTNLQVVQQAQESLTNAKQIVETYKDLSDYQKLNAYKNKICQLVEYNTQASEDLSVPYGNPWQLIYVFDNNSDTNVVCEGYAKAFQLLCNLSTFESEYIQCYTVTGNMVGGTGSGAHMWNMVTMDDENTYLVDITNSDLGAIGQNGDLFLVGSNSGNLSDGYSFSLSDQITFTYDSTSLSLWGQTEQSILNLTSHEYIVNHPTIIVNTSSDIVYDNNAIVAGTVGQDALDVEFSFEGTAYNESLYNWQHQWYTDSNNNMRTLLTESPINAGYYWIKVTATNKVDSSIVYSHSQRIQIMPKQLSVDTVVAQGKTYNGNVEVSVSQINILGVLGQDNVYIDISLVTAVVSSANVGIYTSVSLSNIALLGQNQNNYNIPTTANDIPSNNILVTKATPQCTPTFEKISNKGTLLSQIQLSVQALGVSNETILGVIVWTTEDGTEIDANIVEITQDTIYYYRFTPENQNYFSTINQVTLWPTETQNTTIKSIFTKKNLPKIIEYGAYALVVIVVLVSVSAVIKKDHKKSV